MCVCVCVEEECRLAPSHSAKYLSVTFGALVTCVCECVCECAVCVSPFCCTTVGVLPSVSSWESDLWVCEVWVCEVCVCVCVVCVCVGV